MRRFFLTVPATLVLAGSVLAGCDAKTAASGTTAAAVQTDTAGAADAQADVAANPATDVAADVGDDAAADSGSDAGTDAAAAPLLTGDIRTAKSKSGSYEVSITGPASIAVGKTGEFDATIRAIDGDPTAGLAAKVKFVHKQMGHGGTKTPAIEDMGTGLYHVTDCAPSMAGTWVLKVGVGSDFASFDVVAK